MSKFAWMDDWYPAAFAAANTRDYDALHRFSHGTSNYWDIALRSFGHESETLIANVEDDIVGKTLSLNPSVICVQNVGRWNPTLLRARGFDGKCVAFCSYAADGHNLRDWDCVFSSFRWLVDALNANGQRAVYLPLAFGRPVLERVKYDGIRDIPVSFVGGLGFPNWKRGTEIMKDIAENVDGFRWWGYWTGPPCEPLQRTYVGPAWGHEYWTLLKRTKVLLNRHGEVAHGETNNMRCFEGPAMGCCLLTEASSTFDSIFPRGGLQTYRDAAHAIALCRDLPHGGWGPIADLGRREILENHCYENRVTQFLEAVELI